MRRKRSDYWIAGMVSLVGVGLIGAGLLRSGGHYFVTIDQVRAGRQVRVGGQIAAETWTGESLGRYRFTLVDQEKTLEVVYAGPPIENAEGREVVVEGSLGPDGVFHSTKIITRCASKYASERGKAESL